MQDTYRLSFTFGGLLFPETVEIARRYIELSDWEALRIESIEGALLRKTRASSRFRYFREIRDRLKQAWPFEIEIIAAEKLGARFVVFALCCRYYRLVGDFVREVVRQKVDMRDDHLGYSDYFHFLEQKAHTHPELSDLSESTRTKLRQVSFRMLGEGMLLEKGRVSRIKVPELPENLIHLYSEQGDFLALEHLLYRRNALRGRA